MCKPHSCGSETATQNHRFLMTAKSVHIFNSRRTVAGNLEFNSHKDNEVKTFFRRNLTQKALGGHGHVDSQHG